MSSISVAMFLSFQFVGYYLDFGGMPSEFVNGILSNPLVEILFILPNIAFDLITVFVTIHILKLIAVKPILLTVPLLVCDLAVAILLVAMCILAMDYSTGIISFLIGPERVLTTAWSSFLWIVYPSHEFALSGNVSNFLLASTTLVPTSLFLLLLLTVFLGSLVFRSKQRIPNRRI